jgi:hypothetical protein
MATPYQGARQQLSYFQAGNRAGGRESAVWESALNELIEHDLVVERGYKGEYFELTNKGWQTADALPE